MPTVCSLCPVGCNVCATTREGKVKRILSRNHPEVDEGWLCDKGRFAFAAPPAPRTGSSTRSGASRRRGMDAVAWDEALDEAERLLRAAEGRDRDRALRHGDGRGRLRARRSCSAQGLGAHTAVLPEEVDDSLDAFRLPLSAIRDAELVVVVGDEPVVERAPIVDLWIKAARRQRRRGGHRSARPADPPSAGRRRRRLPRARRGRERALRAARRPRSASCSSGRARTARAARHVAALAERLGFRDKPQSGVFYLPATPNARGVADAWAAASDEEAEEQEPHRAADRLRRRGRRRPGRPRAGRARRGGDRDRRCSRASPRLGRPRPPRRRATSSATARPSTSRAGCSASAAR